MPAQADERLPRAFFDRDTAQVARELLGCRFCLRLADGTLVSTRIVETEGYLGPHDLACHTARGRTPRTEVMFGPPGHAYVYLVYGMHHCLNFVTEPEGHGSAVLVRGLEPLAGLVSDVRLNGPARLTKALGIGKPENGADLVDGERMWVLPPDRPVTALSAGPRVGVDYAGEWAQAPLRFWETGNAHVSPVGAAKPVRPRRGKPESGGTK